MTVSFLPDPKGVTWSHYREVRASPDGDGYWAGTRSLIQPVPGKVVSGDGGGVHLASLRVNVRLVTAESWVVRGHKTADLLNHEQLHYRIAALIGRELDAELMALTASTPADLQRAANQLLADKNHRLSNIEEAYDDDTDHGRIADAQVTWNSRVFQWESSKVMAWP